MTKPYLAVWDDNSGYQGISNVALVPAESEDEALELARACSISHGKLKVYDVEDLIRFNDKWSYYK